MSYTIAKKFDLLSLLKFTVPAIIMMLFMSLYTIVDGIFISRLIGTTALSGLNIVYPFISFIHAVAIMFAAGGSAIIAKKMGEGRDEEARNAFSLIVYTGIFIGICISVFGNVFINEIIRFLGASPVLEKYSYDYLKIIMLFAPFFILQILFQTFFITAGKPELGLRMTIVSGVTNAVLDYLFMKTFALGMIGAALATVSGYLIISIFGIVYFLKKRNSLYFVKVKIDWGTIIESCINGSSEMVTDISSGIVTFLFNIVMMKYMGEKGVAAITIILYSQFVFIAVYLGFSMGTAPIISYNYGNQNKKQLKRIFNICSKLIMGSSVGVFLLSLIFAKYIVGFFAPEGTEVYNIAIKGFSLFAIAYIFAGYNIFSSSLFTALSNGKISAVISFMRTMVFIVLGIFFLPMIFQVNGIWLAVPFAEILSILVSLFFIRSEKGRYGYM
ncbi:MATE family efflux transporter [Fusobacterium sp. THCT1E2]